MISGKRVKPVTAWYLMFVACQLFWRRMGLLMSASILWLGLSVFIVTCPAATVGLFTVVLRIVQDELDADAHLANIKDFWTGVRADWYRGTKLGAANAICLALIASSLWFYGTSPSDPQRWLIGPVALMGLAWTGAQMYMFPLCVLRTQVSAKQIFREGCLIAISHPLNTGSLLLTLIFLAMGVVALAGPVVLVFIAFAALVQTLALRAILVRRGEIELFTFVHL